ncbi:MAG TPA: hypothetical protein VMV94_04530 [Phycisphaerae bacterium]|nr:hypothetical protein [Phycisphaerae bacterium]
MDKDRTFSRAKRYATLLGAMCSTALMIGIAVRSLGADSSVAAKANTRVFVDVETGRQFSHTLQPGDKEPIESPFTGKRTAYAAEACYWKKCPDGVWKAKKQPTWVVLKEKLGLHEETHCPDCGREVVGHNPLPPPNLMAEAH